MSLFSKKEAPVDKGIAPNVYLNYNGATCLVADVCNRGVVRCCKETHRQVRRYL